MAVDSTIYAGVDISSGRKPVILAALDEDLQVMLLQQFGIAEAIAGLNDARGAHVVINTPHSKTGQAIQADFQEKLVLAGFKTFSRKIGDRQWIEAEAEDCFSAFQPRLFAKRNFEGRVQRALILYEQGVQIDDPMEVFEEITPHKLIRGILPSEHMYSNKQLEALVLAYVAWLAVRHPERVTLRDDRILPVVSETLSDELWRQESF